MIGAPALTANAALRSGAGLVQLYVPADIRTAVAVLSPCSTIRTLSAKDDELFQSLDEYQPDVLAVGPGLGDSLSAAGFVKLLAHYRGPVVIDADGLNILAAAMPVEIPNPDRVVFTPHPGEARRLLAACGADREIARNHGSRRAAACLLVEHYGGVFVLKGAKTVVTNGKRLFANETGNSGMATAGAGDVLTGVIAALIGQKMEPLEAAILGVHLHGLAGDFAATELGRRSLTAMDLIDFLPEAFVEHESLATE